MNSSKQDASEPSALERELRRQIHRQGPLTFAWFMGQALYHPTLGYYTRAESPIGRYKDFFTSVSATPWFGRLLAASIRRLAVDSLDSVERVEVHEFGAHRGQLREDILAANGGLLYRTYEIGDGWPDALNGCVLANELLDALPFHRLRVVDGRWCELFVGVGSDGALTWVQGAPSQAALVDHLGELPLAWMEGYETEVCLQMRNWVQEVGRRMTRGFCILIDYGFDEPEYYHPRRAQGGLRTYFNHQSGRDPFVRIGQQDLTCDVNFSDVIRVAAEHSLRVREFTHQGRFLTREIERLLHQEPNPESMGAQLSRSLSMLTHPAFLGADFKVLVLEKIR